MENTIRARPATPDDVDAIAETLTLAFLDDPVWRSAGMQPSGTMADMRPFWRIVVQGAMRYPWVWVAGESAAATAIWIPPAGTDLSEAQEAEIAELAERLLGTTGRDYLFAVLDRFARAHPREEAHYYLSLLATHPDHRGHGIGMDLMRQNLAKIDEEGLPAYLESSNPRNDLRYQGVGFQPAVTFQLPNDGPTVTGMWRSARIA